MSCSANAVCNLPVWLFYFPENYTHIETASVLSKPSECKANATHYLAMIFSCSMALRTWRFWASFGFHLSKLALRIAGWLADLLVAEQNNLRASNAALIKSHTVNLLSGLGWSACPNALSSESCGESLNIWNGWNAVIHRTFLEQNSSQCLLTLQMELYKWKNGIQIT